MYSTTLGARALEIFSRVVGELEGCGHVDLGHLAAFMRFSRDSPLQMGLLRNPECNRKAEAPFSEKVHFSLRSLTSIDSLKD